jgi:hypothetical protein
MGGRLADAAARSAGCLRDWVYVCNTEAKFLMLSHAFEKWEVHRVSLRTDVRNERSRNAILRLGAKFEGIRRADKPATDGTVRDSAMYSIIAAEWPEVRERLIGFLAPRE